MIKREINKQFEPQLEIKVNKRVFSAKPTQLWHKKPEKVLDAINAAEMQDMNDAFAKDKVEAQAFSLKDKG